MRKLTEKQFAKIWNACARLDVKADIIDKGTRHPIKKDVDVIYDVLWDVADKMEKK